MRSLLFWGNCHVSTLNACSYRRCGNRFHGKSTNTGYIICKNLKFRCVCIKQIPSDSVVFFIDGRKTTTNPWDFVNKGPMGPKIPPIRRRGNHGTSTPWAGGPPWIWRSFWLLVSSVRPVGPDLYDWKLFGGKYFLRFDEKTMKNSRKPGMLFVSLSVWVVFDYNYWYIDWYLFKCDDNWIFLVYFWKILSFLRIHHKIFRSFLKAAMVSVYLWACYQFQPIHKILRRSFGQMFYQTHPTRGWRQVIETKSVLSLSIQKICSIQMMIHMHIIIRYLTYIYIYTCIYNMSEQRSP